METLTVTTDQVATVLETAADLYESEQIGWCSGKWVRGTSRISACAEGAILLAAGCTATQINRKLDALFKDVPLAGLALKALRSAINQGGLSSCSVHEWNDTIIGNRMPTRVIVREGLEVETLTEPNIPLAKSQVIEALKQAAKDLRNWEGSND